MDISCFKGAFPLSAWYLLPVEIQVRSLAWLWVFYWASESSLGPLVISMSQDRLQKTESRRTWFSPLCFPWGLILPDLPLGQCGSVLTEAMWGSSRGSLPSEENGLLSKWITTEVFLCLFWSLFYKWCLWCRNTTFPEDNGCVRIVCTLYSDCFFKESLRVGQGFQMDHWKHPHLWT